MKTVNVNIKKLVPEAVIPRYAKAGDAGMDLTATSINETDMYIEYGTGLALELPEGFYGAIVPRSSISNYDLVLVNTPGTIDSGYRGEIKLRFKKFIRDGSSCGISPQGKLVTYAPSTFYKVGDRIGQLIVLEHPLVLLTEVQELESSSRGATGFGSSGK